MLLNELLWALVQQVNGYQCDEAVSEVESLYPDSAKLYNQHFLETVSLLKHIHKFINEIEGKNTPAEESNSSGLYKRAFCGGIKQVLRDFNDLFVEVEDLALNDEHFSIVTMATKLYPLESAVRAIKEAVVLVETKDVIGCQILDVCNNYCHCGVEPVEVAFKTIFKTCLNPFFMQTNMWLLHAELQDPYEEYFILAEECDVLTHDDDENMSIASSVSSLDELDASRASVYKIAVDKLPFFLPYSIARKVLFVGESLIMCQKDPSGIYDSLESAQVEEILDQCGLNPYDILKRIKTFEDGESLNVDTFDAFITDIYNGVNQYARKLAEDMADVRGQLVLMRDLYLLGRGELFHEFILRVDTSLDQVAHKTKGRYLKSVFDDCFYYVYLTDASEILDAVNFTLPSKDLLPAHAMALDCLSLDVKIRWPLESIFPPDIIISFRRMFRFLLKLKKAQITLSESWTNTNIKELDPSTRRIIFVRNKLNAFVVNLQNYCFTDVIEHEMNLMLATVDRSNTYTDIQNAVDSFSKNVSEQLFLNFGNEQDFFLSDISKVNNQMLLESQEEVNFVIHKALADIFKVSGKFRKLTKDVKTAKESHIEIIENAADSAIRTLFQISTIHCNNVHLHNLLLGLDYNDFFRKTYLISDQ